MKKQYILAHVLVFSSILWVAPFAWGQEDESPYLLQRQLASIERDIAARDATIIALTSIITDLGNLNASLQDASRPAAVDQALQDLETDQENLRTATSQNQLEALIKIGGTVSTAEQEFSRPFGDLGRAITNEARIQPSSPGERIRQRQYRELEEEFYVLRGELFNAIYNVSYYEDPPTSATINQVISESFKNTVETTLNADSFNSFRNNVRALLTNRISRLEAEKTREENARNEAVAQADELAQRIGKLEDDQLKIDQTLIWTLPFYGLVMLLLMLIPRVYKDDELRQIIFSSGLLLELITVFLLTAVILLLGIGGKLQSEVLGTLIGGISGYVLGRSVNTTPSNSKENKNQ